MFRWQLNTEWAQVEVVDLINDGSGLGFGIIGGRSTGVVVKTIVPGGVSDRVTASLCRASPRNPGRLCPRHNVRLMGAHNGHSNDGRRRTRRSSRGPINKSRPIYSWGPGFARACPLIVVRSSRPVRTAGCRVGTTSCRLATSACAAWAPSRWPPSCASPARTSGSSSPALSSPPRPITR